MRAAISLCQDPTAFLLLQRLKTQRQIYSFLYCVFACDFCSSAFILSFHYRFVFPQAYYKGKSIREMDKFCPQFSVWSKYLSLTNKWTPPSPCKLSERKDSLLAFRKSAGKAGSCPGASNQSARLNLLAKSLSLLCQGLQR